MRTLPLLLLTAPLLCACGSPAPSGPTLVASIYPVAYLAEQIAGKDFNVVCITPAGAEPHDFELRPSDVRTMGDAKAIFVNGLGMETWSGALPESLSAKTYTVTNGMESSFIKRDDGRVDPHVWLDPTLYAKMGENILDTLVTIDAPHASNYRKRYADLITRLSALDQENLEIARSFDGKVIAVAHAAYGYLCARYGITQLSISDLSPEEEPTQKAIEDILTAIDTYGIDTVFFEENASKEVATRIAEMTGAKAKRLSPIETLYPDETALGEDYFSLYRQNMQRIKESKGNDRI